jgi:hypothetical protein
MTLGFFAIVGRLFQLQILEGEENHAIAVENIVKHVTLATTRGRIVDRDGVILADSRESYNLYAVPGRLDMALTWPKIADYLGLQQEERVRLEEKLTKIRDDKDDPRREQQILLKEDIGWSANVILQEQAADLPGVSVVSVQVRYYPSGVAGAHVLGYMGEVSAEVLPKLRAAGYIEGDRLGVAGTERAWESYLRGTPRPREGPGRRAGPSATRPGRHHRRRRPSHRPHPGPRPPAHDRRRASDRDPSSVQIGARRRRRGRRGEDRAHHRALLEAELRPGRAVGLVRALGPDGRFPSPVLRSAQAGGRQDRQRLVSAWLDVQAVHRARRSREGPREPPASDPVPRLLEGGPQELRLHPRARRHGPAPRDRAELQRLLLAAGQREPGRHGRHRSDGSGVRLRSEDRARDQRRGLRKDADPRVDDLPQQGPLPHGLRHERGHRAGRDHRERAAARARVRRGRERRDPLPASARARGRDVERHGRAGVLAAGSVAGSTSTPRTSSSSRRRWSRA